MTGVYLLTVYGVPRHTDDGPIYIKNNNAVLCRGFISKESGYEAGTCTAVAQLAVGDSVRVTGESSWRGYVQQLYTGFAGHIISDNLTP